MRRTVLVIASLVTVTVTLTVATAVLLALTMDLPRPPAFWGPRGFNLVTALIFALTGTLIARKERRNPIGWIFLVIGVLSSVQGVTEEYWIAGQPSSHLTLPWREEVLWLNSWVWLPLVGALTYVLLFFPDGSLPSPRWRVLVPLAALSIATATLGAALIPGLGMREGEDLPGGAATMLFVWGATGLFGSIIAGALSLVMRFRRAQGVERKQLAWVAYAGAVLGAVALPIFATSVVDVPRWLKDMGEFLQVLLIGAVVGIPVAIAIAILRYRLYDIDVVINRTLVYGALTAALALVYFGGVATTQTIFRALTGQEQQPQLAIVISTLVIAALFNPLRRRIQAFIDRRFYRSRYDARKTLEAFSAKLRDETDLDALSDDLVGVVRETMQPAHVSLWLRPDTAAKKEDLSG